MRIIPDRALPLRADIYRYQIATGEVGNKVHINLPCMIGRKTNYPNSQQGEKSSTTQGSIMICRRQENGVDVDIRIEDHIVIGANKYRVLGVADACSMRHHLEVDIQLLQTMDKAE